MAKAPLNWQDFNQASLTARQSSILDAIWQAAEALEEAKSDFKDEMESDAEFMAALPAGTEAKWAFRHRERFTGEVVKSVGIAFAPKKEKGSKGHTKAPAFSITRAAPPRRRR